MSGCDKSNSISSAFFCRYRLLLLLLLLLLLVMLLFELRGLLGLGAVVEFAVVVAIVVGVVFAFVFVFAAEVVGLMSSATEIRSGVVSPTPSPSEKGIEVFVFMVEAAIL
jgi:hypothetical protein